MTTPYITVSCGRGPVILLPDTDDGIKLAGALLKTATVVTPFYGSKATGADGALTLGKADLIVEPYQEYIARIMAEAEKKKATDASKLVLVEAREKEPA